MVRREFEMGLPAPNEPYPEIEEVIHSPVLANGTGTFAVNLNYGINFVKIHALSPAVVLHSVGSITLLTNEGAITSVARILIHHPSEEYSPYLFHVVESYPVYAGVIGCVSTYDPSESMF